MRGKLLILVARIPGNHGGAQVKVVDQSAPPGTLFGGGPVSERCRNNYSTKAFAGPQDRKSLAGVDGKSEHIWSSIMPSDVDRGLYGADKLQRSRSREHYFIAFDRSSDDFAPWINDA